MENISGKAFFLRQEWIAALETLPENAERKWGKMNLIQMLEHMAEYVAMAYGKPPQGLQVSPEVSEKMRAFLESEKPFRENTPNSLMPEKPPPAKSKDKNTALRTLKNEIENFFDAFEKDPDNKIMNPFFGELNFDQSVQLLYKHALHHLRQFDAAV